jgi:hypothetical protein
MRARVVQNPEYFRRQGNQGIICAKPVLIGSLSVAFAFGIVTAQFGLPQGRLRQPIHYQSVTEMGSRRLSPLEIGLDRVLDASIVAVEMMQLIADLVDTLEVGWR